MNLLLSLISRLLPDPLRLHNHTMILDRAERLGGLYTGWLISWYSCTGCAHQWCEYQDISKGCKTR